jgi:hypothetical protein
VCTGAEEEEGLHGVFKRLRHNGHLNFRKLHTAQLRLSLKEAHQGLPGSSSRVASSTVRS